MFINKVRIIVMYMGLTFDQLTAVGTLVGVSIVSVGSADGTGLGLSLYILFPCFSVFLGGTCTGVRLSVRYSHY